MDSKIWGAYAWYFIHLLTYCMPSDINEFNKLKQYYADFFNSLLILLPCPKCRKHYKSYLIKHTIAEHCVNKNKAIQWMIDLHNDVNRRLSNYGIKKKIYSKTEIDNIYLDKSGKVQINHQKLAVFPNIILNTNTDINQCKIFLNTLKYIHPCKSCSTVIADELNIIGVNNLTTKEHLINLSNKLIPRIRIEHNSNALIPAFKLFNRQFILNKDNHNIWNSIVFDPNITFYRICFRNNRWELFIVYKNNSEKILFTNKLNAINPPLHEISWERQ